MSLLSPSSAARPAPSAKSSLGALSAMVAPRSIVIVGASDDPGRIGGRPLAYMLRQGFNGELFPVNPNRATVQGVRSYRAIADLPYPPDLAIVAVAAENALQAMEELAARGAKAAVVFSSGFAEMAGGEEAQRLLVAAARKGGVRMLGPNSLGLYNVRVGCYATFSTSFQLGWPRPGHIALASQSGAFAAHIFTAARLRRIGVSLCAMTGNEADVTLGELMRTLVDDAETHVIGVQAEGIRDAEAFTDALEAAHRARKPVIVMKTGHSAIGRLAAQSHTASIAGDDAVFDAVLREFGAVRARSAEQFLDFCHLATRRIYPTNNTLGMISISGGAGVLVSDAAEELGLAMPPMPKAAQDELKALLPFASVRNPVDCTAQVLNELPLIGCFTESMVKNGGYASVLAFFTMAGGAPSSGPSLRAQLGEIRARYPDRLYVLSIMGSEECVDQFEADGFTVFEDPTRAAVAIDAMGRLGEAFSRPLAPRPALERLRLPARPLNEADAKALLREVGITFAPEKVCHDADEAAAAARELGYPVVVKILSPDIAHKSDIGGVVVGVADEAGLRKAFVEVLDNAIREMPGARIDGVLVSHQIEGGAECIVGAHRDPVFGPIAMFGLGGVFVEVMKDVVLHRCPLDEAGAEAMIRGVRAASLLQGARGRPPVDIPALARMLSRLSQFAFRAGTALRSVEMNPVRALPEGKGCYAVDAWIDTRPGGNE